MNRRYPRYPDDADYQTNSPSYYEDLARLQKLFKLLSKRIWEYDEELAKRFEAWDKNLEEFPDEVLRLLQEWMNDGTFDHIINEVIFDELNDKIRSQGINIKDYGAVGDGVTDDTQSIIDALNAGGKYVYGPSNNNERYVINNEIEIPENVELDFKNSRVLFNDPKSCFNVGLGSTIKNIQILDVPPTFELEKAVFYFDGNKHFIVGEHSQPTIKNIKIKRDVGLYSYQGTAFHLEAAQINPNIGSFISGVTVENIVITRFRYGIRNTVNGIVGSNMNTYITSNNFFNVSSFNTMNFIYDDEIIGDRSSIQNNTYTKMTLQPEDDHPQIYAHIRGRYNDLRELSFWDNGRPSNDIQIIIDGSYNNISGQNLPPFNTNYLQNNGRYNTIQGSTFGTPSLLTSNLVADRSMTTLFNGKYGSVPFTIDSSIAEVTAPVANNFFEMDVYESLELDLSELRVGHYKFVINASGFGSDELRTNRFGVMINGMYLTGGSLEGQQNSTWRNEIIIYLRMYENSFNIVANLDNVAASGEGSYLWVDEYSSNNINQILTIDCMFGTSVENGLIKKASDINVTVPY